VSRYTPRRAPRFFGSVCGRAYVSGSPRRPRPRGGAPADLFLFDEPFSAIDAATREQLRSELLSFLRELSIPAVFVTHDHTDALTLADKIVVLRDGVTMQAGAATDIFHKPVNPFVACFVGIENVLRAHVQEPAGDCATVAIGDQVLHVAPFSPSLRSRSQVNVSIRADDVILRPPASAPATPTGGNRFAARLTGVRLLGVLATAEVDCGFTLKACLLAREARAMDLAPGCAVELEIAPQAIHVMAD
jgi:ABC-type Fe3+/spermidine/putrescine transport system ATPase subunit